ncbi:MAG: hypothetical protein ACKVU1_16490 [bacterium]
MNPRGASRFLALPDIGLATIILLHVALIWWPARFPTQDGPAHLHNADALLRISDPESPAFGEYYEVNATPSPNWLGHATLAFLLTMFSPVVAEKVFLSTYVIAFALAVRFALGSTRTSAASLALLSTPFILSWHLQMGFYNFCLGVVVWCVAFGYWLRRGGLRTWRQIGLFMVFCLLLYASHLIALGALGLVIGAVTLWTTVSDRIRHRGRPANGAAETSPPGSLRARLLAPLVAALPAIALFAIYQRNGESHGVGWVSTAKLTRELMTMDPLVALNENERPFGIAYAACLALLFALALIVRRRDSDSVPSAGLFAAAASLFALYFAAPSGVGGCWYVNGRILVFAVLALIIAIGSAPLRPWIARTAAVSGFAFGIAFLLARQPTILAAGELLAESLTAAPLVAPNSTILSLGFSHRGRSADGSPLSTRIKPFLHTGAAIAAERGAIDVRNYEANTSVFPVRYRFERNPFRAFGSDPDMEAEPPRVDFINYAKRTGASVDYILVSGFGPEHEHNLAAKGILKQLSYGYERIFVSPGTGFVQLYKAAARQR